MHANINVNIVIMISQAFKHKIKKNWVRFEFAYNSVLAISTATICACYILHNIVAYHIVYYLLHYTVLNEYICVQ